MCSAVTLSPLSSAVGHRGIHFIFKQNSVAHHHRFGVRTLRECCPSPESHERRHRPAIDGDFHVAARQGNLINAFLLVELAFEPGDTDRSSPHQARQIAMSILAQKIAQRRRSVFIISGRYVSAPQSRSSRLRTATSRAQYFSAFSLLLALLGVFAEQLAVGIELITPFFAVFVHDSFIVRALFLPANYRSSFDF